jgi:hypothetical protein
MKRNINRSVNEKGLELNLDLTQEESDIANSLL